MSENQSYQSGYDVGYRIGYERAQTEAPKYDLCFSYPTKQMVADFLVSDNTSERIYDRKSFVCTDFADKVIENSWKRDIPCYMVWLTFENVIEGHTIIVFPTSDSGDIFVDPMEDLMYDSEVIEVGNLYPAACENGGFCKIPTIGRIRIFR